MGLSVAIATASMQHRHRAQLAVEAPPLRVANAARRTPSSSSAWGARAFERSYISWASGISCHERQSAGHALVSARPAWCNCTARTVCTPHARRGRREGCSAFASSRTRPSGTSSAPVGCAGVEAKAHCKAQPSCPHHLRAHPARAAARSARAKGALSRQVTEKVVRFRPLTSADLRGQHDQALRAWASELRVTSLLTLPCNVDGSLVSFRRCRLRAPVGAQRRDQGLVTAEGLSTPGRAIDDEVQPASVIFVRASGWTPGFTSATQVSVRKMPSTPHGRSLALRRLRPFLG